MCQVLQGGKLDPPALSSLWWTLREMQRTDICGTAEEAAIQQESAEKFATKCLGMVMGRGIDSNKTRQSSRSVSTKQQAPRRGRRKARPKSRSNKEKVSHYAAPTLPPPWKPDKDLPKETAQATSSSADAGTSAELALCLREAYPDPKSMPESALKALTKVDVRSSKQTQLWLHLLPDELDIPKPAAPVTAREYNRVHDIPSSFAELQVQDDSTSMLATLLSSTSSTAQRWWGPIRCSSLFRLKQGRGLSPLDVPVA